MPNMSRNEGMEVWTVEADASYRRLGSKWVRDHSHLSVWLHCCDSQHQNSSSSQTRGRLSAARGAYGGPRKDFRWPAINPN